MGMTPIEKLISRQDDWQSGLVSRFESALEIKVRRAERRLVADVSNRLKIESGKILRSPENIRTLRSVGPAFERQMAQEGYGPLVTAFVAQFPHQFRFFEDSMALMGLPRINWATRDQSVLEAQQLQSIGSIEGVVRIVAENAKRRALMNVGGLKVSDLAELLGEEYGKTKPIAVGLADTAISIFYRTLAERGYARYEQAGIDLRFRYYGPDDQITRRFCRSLVEGRKTYTRIEIDRMDNGQIPNVFLSGGGYRCRHQWILSFDGMLDEAPSDPKKQPEAVTIESSSATMKSALESALESTSPEIQRLAAKAGPVRIERGKSPTYDPNEKLIAAPPLVSRENLLHEMAHHIDYSIGETPVSMDRSTTIGEALFQERNRLGKLPAAKLQQLAEDVKESSVFVRDLYGSLTLNKIPGAHITEYYFRDFDRMFREAFADLLTVFATNAQEWADLKVLSPALADAFEKWLKEVD